MAKKPKKPSPARYGQHDERVIAPLAILGRLQTLSPVFQQHYAHAREASADAIFEEILAIADDSAGDFMETADGRKPDWENVQRSRLRIDTRKWTLARMLPKKYGDRTALDAVGDGTLEIIVIQGRRIKIEWRPTRMTPYDPTDPRQLRKPLIIPRAVDPAMPVALGARAQPLVGIPSAQM